MIKKYVVLFISLFLVISCQTARVPEGLSPNQEPGDESVADISGENEEDFSTAGEEQLSDGEVAQISGGEVAQNSAEDLESEFLDSEDFEDELMQEAFPENQGQAQVEQGAEDTDLSLDDSGDVSSQDVSSEEVSTEEDSDEISDGEGVQVAETVEDTEFVEDTDLSLDDSGDVSSEEVSTEGDIEVSVADGTEDSTGSTVVINNIRYESDKNQIYVDGTGSFSYQSRENKENKQFIIEIPGAILSDSLRMRPFVMKDFNTDIALLQADQKDSNTVRIVLQMRETASMPSVEVSSDGSSLVVSSSGVGKSFDGQSGGLNEQGVYTTTDGTSGGMNQGGSSYSGATSNVLPAKTLEDFYLNTPQFVGSPISLSVQDVDVKDVLYFISENTGLNMVILDDVGGSISLKLRNVPWDQALVTVMKIKNLGYLREGNIIRIMSLKSFEEERTAIEKMITSRQVLEPFKVKVIPLVYTKVGEIKQQLGDFLTKGNQSEGGVTPRAGKIVEDKNSNSLIITDTARVIERIEKVIKNLDRSPVQVMIEAKVVEARETLVRDIGVNWSFVGTPFDSTRFSTWPQQYALGIGGGLTLFPADRSQGGAASGRTLAQSMQVRFAPLGQLEATLGIAEAEGQASILSSPRVLVLNGETAKITQTAETISVSSQVDQTGQPIGTTPQRTPASLEFQVTPQITALGSVFMEVKLKREFFEASQEAQSGARPKNSREAETKVLVNNGQTIVIGGIYQQDEQRADEGFPVLRHIPILKWLFSKVTKQKQKNELLLFLTPRVLNFAGTEADSTEIN